VYVYNAGHTRGVFGRRIAENLASPEPEVRWNAIEVLPTEAGAIPAEMLHSLASVGTEDVANGVQLALTRRGLLAVAANVTE